MSRAALAVLCVLALLPTAAATHEPPPQSPDLYGQGPECKALPLWDGAMCAADNAAEEAGPWVDWTVDMAGWAADQALHQVDFVRCDVIGGPACTNPLILEALRRVVAELLPAEHETD